MPEGANIPIYLCFLVEVISQAQSMVNPRRETVPKPGIPIELDQQSAASLSVISRFKYGHLARFVNKILHL